MTREEFTQRLTLVYAEGILRNNEILKRIGAATEKAGVDFEFGLAKVVWTATSETLKAMEEEIPDGN